MAINPVAQLTCLFICDKCGEEAEMSERRPFPIPDGWELDVNRLYIQFEGSTLCPKCTASNQAEKGA